MKYLLTIAVCAVLFLAGVQSTEAKSVTWSGISYGNFDILVGWFGTGAGIYFSNPQHSISYSADMYYVNTNTLIPDNSTIASGQSVEFRPKAFQYSDISWFTTGYNSDSPYGHWTANAASQGQVCGTGAYIPLNLFGLMMDLVANPPQITYDHSGSTASITCDSAGNICSINSAGTVKTNVNFNATYANYYAGFVDGLVGCIDYYWWFGYDWSPLQIGIPAQTISFNLVAYNPNQPPTPPTITGPGGLINTSLPFSFTATDPESNPIAFLIDWNNDGVGDQWSSARWSGSWTSSGGSATVAYAWSSLGTKTFQARTMDSGGNYSGWAQHTITVVAPDLISENLTVSSGPYFAGSSIALSAGVRNISTTATPSGFSDNFSYRWGTTGWNNLSYTGKGVLVGGGFSPDTNTFTPTQSGTLYIQHCVDSYNNVPESSEANCTVSAPLTVTKPTGNLTVESPINVNTKADISWNTSDTSNCTLHIDEPAGVDAWTVSASGSKESKILYRPTTYTLTCPNYPGFLAQEVVDVNYEPEVFANPRTVLQGDVTKITWEIYGQIGCTLSGGEISNLSILDGEEKITTIEGRTTYTISCPDLLGGPNLTDSVTVDVIPRGFET